MQPLASFYDLKFHSHRQISLAADVGNFGGIYDLFGVAVFDPNQVTIQSRRLQPELLWHADQHGDPSVYVRANGSIIGAASD